MLGARKAVAEILSLRLSQAILLVLAAVTVMTTSTLLSIKTVKVSVDGGSPKVITTMDKEVGVILARNNIAVGEHDVVSPPLASSLKQNQNITIARAFTIYVNIGNERVPVQTVSKSVAQVLTDAGIAYTEADIVTPSLDSVVNKETEISITKVVEERVTVTEAIPFTTVSNPNSALARGTTKVTAEGRDGSKESYYNVVYHNGEVVSKELVGEKVVTEPVNQISEYGTAGVQMLSSRSGEVRNKGDFSYSSVIDCTATAYDLSFESCGKYPGDKWYGITASGMQAQRGVIAVDPRVIPLGTRLYIESTDSYPDYGYAIAGDTGGAIKGHRVDLFMDSRSEALQFGRRGVKVYILD